MITKLIKVASICIESNYNYQDGGEQGYSYLYTYHIVKPVPTLS